MRFKYYINLILLYFTVLIYFISKIFNRNLIVFVFHKRNRHLTTKERIKIKKLFLKAKYEIN